MVSPDISLKAGNYDLSFDLTGTPFGSSEATEYINVYFANSTDTSNLTSAYKVNLVYDSDYDVWNSKVFDVAATGTTNDSLTTTVALPADYKYIIIEVELNYYCCDTLTISDLTIEKQASVLENVESETLPVEEALYSAELGADAVDGWTYGSWTTTAYGAQATGDAAGWLISAPYLLAANSTYNVYFKVKTEAADSFEVRYATSASGIAKGTVGYSKENFKTVDGETPAYVWLSFNFTTGAAIEEYYFGFNATSTDPNVVYVKGLGIYGNEIEGIDISKEIYQPTNFNAWRVVNANEDKFTWKTYGAQKYYPYNTDRVTPADDWLISPAFALTEGKKYVITYAAKGTTSGIEKLGVYIANAGYTESLKVGTLIDDIITEKNSNLVQRTIEYTPTSSGNFYIGLYAHSDADQYNLYVTNFTIAEKISANKNGTEYVFAGVVGDIEDAVINDTKACVYDLSEIGATMEVNPVNTNAYVIGGANITTSTANKLAYDAENDSYSAEAININSDKAFHPGYAVATTSGVNFSRTVTADKYVTAVLPFDITAGANEIAVLNGFFTENETEYMGFNYVTGTVAAYTPFMYLPNSTELTFAGTNVAALAEYSGGLQIKQLDGNWYQAFSFQDMDVDVTTTLSGYDVYYFNAENKFMHATGTLHLKPFRVIYLLKNSGGAAAPAYFRFLIDGDVPTGLEEMYYNEDAAANEAPAYNEAGVRVSEEYKGITIRNGKKTIRK